MEKHMEVENITKQIAIINNQIIEISTSHDIEKINDLIINTAILQEKLRDLKFLIQQKTFSEEWQKNVLTTNNTSIQKEQEIVPKTNIKESEPTKIVNEESVLQTLEEGETILMDHVPQTLHEQMTVTQAKKDINETITKKVNTLVLDLNDRIYLQRSLFNNDSEDMRAFLNELSTHGIDENFMHFMKEKSSYSKDWDFESEPVKRLVQILEKSI